MTVSAIIGAVRNMKFGIVLAFAAAATLAAGSASAVVQITNVQLAGPGSYYTVDINGEDVYDDALVLTIDGHQVLVNCDDLFHNIDLGQTASFNVSSFSSLTSTTNFDGLGGTYNSDQIDAMSWLLDTSTQVWKTGSANPNEQLDLAALQLASWMVGNPHASFTNYDQSVWTKAQTYISESTGTTFPGSFVEQLTSNDGVQGQIMDPILTPIPEPATWAMMLFGLFGLGTVLRSSRAVWSSSRGARTR